LFFLDDERGLVATEVEADSVFRVLRTESLFTLGPEYIAGDGIDWYDIGPDDERFLMVRFAPASFETSSDVRLILVQNWFEELRERVGN